MNRQRSIGQQIRTIRKSKKLTIEDIASRTGFTSSFISQFERDLTTASIASLQKITAELDIDISSLFTKDEERQLVYEQQPVLIKKAEREKIIHSAPLNTIDYYLNKQGHTEVIYSEIEIGGSSREAYLHNSNEKIVIVLQGELTISVEEHIYVLVEGDTLTFPSKSYHEWKNTGDTILNLIWIVAHSSSSWKT